jgi:hypothetical protein
MTNLLYHWNFTNDTSVHNALNNMIYDSEANLSAKVIARNTISSSTVSRDENGIDLNNADSDAGICIDLLGLDDVQLGGNISIEMVLKNEDLSRNAIYFQTIRDVEGEVNNDSAYITCKYNTKTKLMVRTDNRTNSGYSQKTASVSNNQIDNTNFFHYIFTLSYASGNSSIKIFINGVERAENTAGLTSQLTNTLRQSNLIGTQKNPTDAVYLKGVIKYLKIYQNAMASSEVVSTYNNYNTAPYYSDIVSGTNAEKYTRRHSTLNTYFTDNPSITSFSMTGNQLGLLSPANSYNVHKFTNGGDVDISSGYHYIPLSGQNQFIIFKNGTTWYKITQTSADDGSSAIYKYEKSTDSGDNYDAPVTGNTFGQSITDGSITIGFGGAESGQSGSESGNGKLTVKSNGKLVVKLNGKITIK